MQGTFVHAYPSFESVLASSFQVSAQIGLFFGAMFGGALGFDLEVEEEITCAPEASLHEDIEKETSYEEQVGGHADETPHCGDKGDSELITPPVKMRKLDSAVSEALTPPAPCVDPKVLFEKPGDVAGPEAVVEEKAVTKRDWPNRKTFAGRRCTAQNETAWHIKRESFYMNVASEYWKDHFERQWWKIYEGEVSALEAKEIFMAQVAEKASEHKDAE